MFDDPQRKKRRSSRSQGPALQRVWWLVARKTIQDHEVVEGDVEAVEEAAVTEAEAVGEAADEEDGVVEIVEQGITKRPSRPQPITTRRATRENELLSRTGHRILACEDRPCLLSRSKEPRQKMVVIHRHRVLFIQLYRSFKLFGIQSANLYVAPMSHV